MVASAYMAAGDESMHSPSIIASPDSLEQPSSLNSWLRDIGLNFENSSSEEEAEPSHFVNSAHFRYVMDRVWSEESLRACEDYNEDMNSYRQFLSKTVIFQRLLGMVASHISDENYFPSRPVFSFLNQEPLSQSSSYESMLELIRGALNSMAAPREEEPSFSDGMLVVSSLCSSSGKCDTNTRSSITSASGGSASTSATSFIVDQTTA